MDAASALKTAVEFIAARGAFPNKMDAGAAFGFTPNRFRDWFAALSAGIIPGQFRHGLPDFGSNGRCAFTEVRGNFVLRPV